jgi:hypothetical protein
MDSYALASQIYFRIPKNYAVIFFIKKSDELYSVIKTNGIVRSSKFLETILSHCHGDE